MTATLEIHVHQGAMVRQVAMTRDDGRDEWHSRRT